MRGLFLGFVVCAACTSSSTGTTSSAATTTGGCPPHEGTVEQGAPGTRCDSPDDCKAPTCYCGDGTSGIGPRACEANTCDGAKSCQTFCASKGGVAPCPKTGGGW